MLFSRCALLSYAAALALVLTFGPSPATARPAASPQRVGTLTVDVQLTGLYHATWVRDPAVYDVNSDGTATLDVGAHFVLPIRSSEGIASVGPTATGTLVTSEALGGAGSFSITQVHNGGFHEHGTCEGAILVAPDAPDPVLTTQSSADGLLLHAQTLTSADTDNDAYDCPPATTDIGTDDGWTKPGGKLFYPLDVSTPLPQALTATAQLDDGVLDDSGTTTIKVDSGAIDVPATCTAEFQSPGDSCTQSMAWNGTVKVTVDREDCPDTTISSVTDTHGHTLSTAQRKSAGIAGKHFRPGQTITASGQGMVLHLLQNGQDAGTVEMSGGASLTIPDDCGKDGYPIPISTAGFLERGLIWLKRELTGSKAKFEVGTERAVLGVRGSSYTLGRDPKTGDWLMHVLEGDGYAGTPGRLHDVPAGRGVLMTASGPRLTSRWPAAQRAMVPHLYLPATVTHLRLRHAAAGTAKARVGLTLDRRATVVVRVLRKGDVVARRTVRAARGASAVQVWKHRLHAGKYAVALTVTTPQRAVALTSTTFRVHS